MAVVIYIGALIILLIGALILNFGYQYIEGRTYFIHYELIIMIVVAGGLVFPFWGWESIAWTLGISSILSIFPPAWERIFGESDKDA